MSEGNLANAMALIRELHPRRRVHNADDLDASLDTLADWIRRSGFRGGVRIHEFSAGGVFNHWVVPPKWRIHQASLRRRSGASISLEHPLAVIPYSASFQGVVSRDELLRHVRFDQAIPEAIPFAFRQMYRHWEKDWGFALPHRVVADLTDGEYVVDLRTSLDPEPMKVLEYYVPGRSDRIVQLAAHIDHPGQANDGLSGVAGALMAVRGLELRSSALRLSYSVLVCPEIVGSAVYLAREEAVRQRIVAALCPNMLGHNAPIALSLSKSMDSRLDRALKLALWSRGTEHVVGPWHKYPDCGDEISYDAPGYDIPASTISRIGERFREYHTSLDTPDIIDLTKLGEAVDVMRTALEYLDADQIPRRKFSGNPSLANPDLDLYLEPTNIGNRLNVDQRVWLTDVRTKARQAVDARNFQEMFISNLEGRASLIDIAYSSGVTFEFVLAYAKAFQGKGLISMEEAGMWPGPVITVSLDVGADFQVRR